MGMSASQARYLQLTARKSDYEFEAQQICQKRLELAQYTEQAALEYTNKINDRRLYFLPAGTTTFGSLTTGLNQLTYANITDSIEDGGMNMRIVTAEGKIVVPSLPETIPEGMSEDDYCVTTNCLNADLLDVRLRGGNWFLESYDSAGEDGTVGWETVQWETSSFIYDALYTDNDPAAEAEYAASTAAIQSKDKQLQLKLDQIATLQKSIDTELDSVKKVLDKNIETSFKTFG